MSLIEEFSNLKININAKRQKLIDGYNILPFKVPCDQGMIVYCIDVSKTKLDQATIPLVCLKSFEIENAI